MENEKYEIVKFVDNEFELDVRKDNYQNTVWLTQKEMSLLFEVTIDTISLHIKNIFKDNELDFSVFEESSITASDGKIYKTKIYNLDMIISIGYRVKSKRGITFRKWAIKIIKQFLENGFSINEKRCLNCQDNLLDLKDRVSQLESKINNENDIYKEKLFYEDQIFDGYSLIKKILLSSKEEIIIIDGYIDLSVLDMLNEITVPITIYTFPSTNLTNQDIYKFQIKHSLSLIKDNKYHDRFLIIDNDVYVLGSSIKDIGKKRSVMTKLTSITKEMIIKQAI